MWGISWRRVRTIIRKELLVLLGDPVSRFMIIGPPLLQIVIFGWAATLEVRNVRAAFVNHDSGSWSREIIHRLEGSPTFTSVRQLPGDQSIKKAIDNQEALLVLVFDQEFSRNVERGRPAQVEVILDGRRSNAAQIATAYLGEIVSGVAAATPLSRLSAQDSPRLDISTRCWFNPNLRFQWYFIPNLIGMLSLMVGLVVTGLSVAREREIGTFDQLLVSPATPLEIAIAKLCPGCLIGILHGTIFLIIAVYGFGIPLNGSLVLLYVALFIFAFSSGGVGLMISSVCSTQQQAFLGAFALGVPIIIISGAITPLLNMPVWLQHVSEINPLRHFIVIIQGVFLKDITATAAIINLAKITAISVVCVTVAIWMFRRRS